MLEGLRTEEEKVRLVVTLLTYGCPRQAIVHAFGLDERTVAAWQRRAGTHCKHVHMDIVQQGKVESHHIQADEIRAKGRKIIVWIALAMDVTTRLWLAGTVTQQAEREVKRLASNREELIERIARIMREDGTAQPLQGLYLARASFLSCRLTG